MTTIGQYNDNNDILIADGNQLDSLGRIRISESGLVESLYFSHSAHSLLTASVVTGSATVSLNTSAAAMRLTATTSSSDTAIFQTKRFFRYSPGYSYLTTMGCTLGAAKSNVTQRIGYFHTNNGLFFEQTSSGISIAVRTNTSGSPVDTKVAQSSWNLDKLDGTGVSGVTLDTSKQNTYVIDFFWHSSGRVRFGIMQNGRILYCHQIDYANSITLPFMRSPSLPIRAELNNTSTTASTTTLDVVSFAFQKESSSILSAPYSFSASNGRTSTNVGSTTLPLISIRPKSTFNSITNRIAVVPESVSVLTLNQPVLVSIVLNPTLTGSSFVSADSNSAVEYDVTATAVSGGTVIKQFYVAASSSLVSSTGSSSFGSIRSVILGLDIPGTTADIVTITALSTAGGTNVFAQIDWQEYQ